MKQYNVLVIEHAMKSQEGTYQCRDGNTTVIEEINLVVEVKPASPGQPSVNDITSCQVLLNWLPSNNSDFFSSAITYFVLQSMDGNEMINSGVNTSSTYAVITSLRSQTNYSFAVIAKANNLTSLPSPESKQITTLKESAIGIPQDVAATSWDTSTIQVSWKRPSNDLVFCRISGYIIMYAVNEDNAQKENVTVEQTDITSVEISGLDASTKYVIWVAFVSGDSIGNYSTPVNETTQQAKPSAPTNFHVKDLRAFSMDLSWKPSVPVPGDPIAKYIIEYWETGTDELFRQYQTALGQPKVINYNLTELEAATEYSTQVSAISMANVRGDTSIMLNTTTDSRRPSVPRSLKVTYLTKTTAVVLWAPPAYIFKQVDYYLVKYWKLDTPQEKVRMVSGEVASYCRLDNLVLNTKYAVTVQAITFSIKNPTRSYYGRETPVYHFMHADPAQTTTPVRPVVTILSSTLASTPVPMYAGEPEDTVVKIAIIVGVIIAVLLICLVFLILFVFRKRFQSPHYYMRADSVQRPTSPELGLPDMPTILQENAIPIDAFEKHVMNLHTDSDNGFSVEYDELRKIPSKHLTCLNSKLQENKNRNRYWDIVAYDHTRVHLHPISGQPKNTDYINANYVDGYHKPKAFIASQGPLKSTITEFWQMIWEQNSVIIIMLTNLVEKGKRKCEQYWPLHGTEQYGFIEVTLEDTNTRATFTVRRFTVKNLKAKKIRGQHMDRMIYQYHYTAWPDHGIPEDSLPVISFVKKSSAANPPEAGPIIVHCSAGVGRTGTYIVIDTMLHLIKDKKCINIMSFMKHIRQQRNYLVQTEGQYIFLHDALLEAVRSGVTEVNMDEYDDYFKSLQDKILLPDDSDVTVLAKQYMRISKYVPKDYELHSATRPYNILKNASEDVLPIERSRVKLLPKPGVDGSDYINGSFLQGYRSNQEYIVTQHPLQHTAVDFWRMIWDHNSQTIVSLISSEDLEKGKLAIYWPTPEKKDLDCVNFTVTLSKEEHHLNMITRDYIIQSNQDDYIMEVRQFQCGYWPDSCAPPETIFELITTVQRWKQQFEGPVTVHDKFGSTTAVTFCALSTLLQQLKHEDSIDVYSIMLLYNLRRPGCFLTKDKFEFLYTAMKAAVELRQKERKVGARNQLPSNSTQPKRHSHQAGRSIRRALSLSDAHNPSSPKCNMSRSVSLHTDKETNSPTVSFRKKKVKSNSHQQDIAEEYCDINLGNSVPTQIVDWKVPTGRGKSSNNNRSPSDYRESGFEDDEVFVYSKV
uniref:Tyrosine-protein phosphatase 99A-like n=1 Tax=Saccoglossus kowalevskii TaxID=10224 RepID=A0ABM0MQK2_SACKO|nr:PREDICTED: tyrosine-protein phosphatase 99A-like [Saccoglossus kowalevskii]